MSYTLGLDLGSNSIGWALVNEPEGKIVACGVRIFQEGVDRDQKGGEVSKNEARRIARGMRRQIARRARRKKLLRSALVNRGLLPASTVEQTAVTASDPYALRSEALHKKLSLYEIGRVLIHFNQRRGFLSNRKTDKGKDKELKGMLAEISELAASVKTAGHSTLGEYFGALRAGDPLVRVRGKHTRREMYEQEFAAIWEVQSKHHPRNLTPQLREQLHKIIFFQRKMYWPRSVVGMCELEPNKRRCRRSDLAAQRFRLLQEVNNLRLLDTTTGEERSLTTDERSKLSEYLSTAKERTFDQIRKCLGLLESCAFNFERGDRSKLLGMPTDAALAHKDLFGKEWYSRPFGERDATVRTLLNDDLDEQALHTIAVEQWGLSSDAAWRVVGLELPAGYVNFSREAIDKLLPHLEQGLLLMTDDGTPSALVEAGYLRPDQRHVRVVDQLPLPPDLPNPIVRRALHELRRVVNAVIREHGKPDQIHVELAREVKGSLERRRELSRQLRDRQSLRESVAEKIREAGFSPNREAVNRYLLWQEQGEVCIYSGKAIGVTQLFGGEVDIDHILPYGRSLDDSLMNRVVCFRAANADKRDRTPYEWLGTTDVDRYDKIIQRAGKLPYSKRRKFLQKEIALEDFIARQLNDTAYITRATVDYLKSLGSPVLGSKGQLTAELRWRWGLDTVLRDDGLHLKNRDDHRHHAVDAIVIALTDQRRLQQLAKADKGNQLAIAPWTTFRDDVSVGVNKINVSHRVQRKVKGALHEETIYGPTEVEGEFVYRKPLEALTNSMIEDIRDDQVKQIIQDRLQEYGIKPGDKKKIPVEVWKEPLLMTRKAGRTSTAPAHIKKVRLIRKEKTIQGIRNNTAFVKPGSLHHVCIFEVPNTKGVSKRDAVFVSMIEAARRVRDGESIIKREHPTSKEACFVISLSADEMVLLNHEGREDLYRFETAASTSQQMWFRHHTAAGKSSEKLGEVSKRPNTLEVRKVTVDPLGRIRDAGD